MAAMVRLLAETDSIVEASYQRKNAAEEQRLSEYAAAVKIQSSFSCFKSTILYDAFKYECNKHTEKMERIFGKKILQVLCEELCIGDEIEFLQWLCYKVWDSHKFSFLEKWVQPQCVQKVWRGYYVRKYVFNYYSRKRYLEALAIKNEIIRNELEEYAEQQEQNKRRQTEAKERVIQEKLARKYHYLISTHVIPGVFNSPFLPYPTEMEYTLANVKPLVHKRKKISDNPYDPAWKSYNHELPKPAQLPPLASKPQGPFREPESVQQQRYKSFQPTLRVATSYTSLEEARERMKAEEWVTRLNDDIFLPFTRKDQKYDPLLHTKSNYGHLPYGTKFFRAETIDKHVTNQAFKTVVPPIPIFDKLNNTYSQGQV